MNLKVLAIFMVSALIVPAGMAFASLTMTSISTPTLTAGPPVVRVEDAGTSGCATTPSINATGSSIAIVSTGGTTDYGACLLLRDTASTVRVFKVRYVSGTNENRFNDVQVKSAGGTQHMKWSSGTLSTSETGSWQTIAAGSTASLNLRIRINSGPASVITAEILVAKDSLPNVYAVYPLTLTFSAT